MRTYLLRKLTATVPVVLIVTALVYLLQVVSPGDPITLLVPMEELQDLTEEDLDALRRRYGLDRPIVVQYADWLGGVLTGDLGRSIRSREPVTEILARRLPVTLELAMLSLVCSLIVSIPAGILAAYRRNSVLDFLASGVSLAGVSLPNFWLALLLVLLFSVQFDLLPPSGYVSIFDDPAENLKRMAMPVITLATGLMAQSMRMTRSAVLEVLRQDYVTTARAKGLAETPVLRRHALKNALIPVIAIVGLQFGGLLGGAFLIEHVFSIPGIGKASIDAVFDKDFPVVQGTVLLAIVVRIVTNIAADIVSAAMDPRIRLG